MLKTCTSFALCLLQLGHNVLIVLTSCLASTLASSLRRSFCRRAYSSSCACKASAGGQLPKLPASKCDVRVMANLCQAVVATSEPKLEHASNHAAQRKVQLLHHRIAKDSRVRMMFASVFTLTWSHRSDLPDQQLLLCYTSKHLV